MKVPVSNQVHFDTFIEFPYNPSFSYPNAICQATASFSEFREERYLMGFKVRSTTSRLLSNLCAVSRGLCIFVFLLLPQLAVPTSAKTTEGNCPCQENEESSENELVACSSQRRRLHDRRHEDHRWSHESSDRFRQIAFYSGCAQATVGHHFVNGLCAPLLI